MSVGPRVRWTTISQIPSQAFMVVAAREIPPLISNKPQDLKISLVLLLNLLAIFWGCLLLLDVQERRTELKSLQERHSMELRELKQAKAAEMLLLNNSLLEKTKAASALSCELEESRRLAEVRENKLKAQVTEEITRMEKMFHQEKVS